MLCLIKNMHMVYILKCRKDHLSILFPKKIQRYHIIEEDYLEKQNKQLIEKISFLQKQIEELRKENMRLKLRLNKEKISLDEESAISDGKFNEFLQEKDLVVCTNWCNVDIAKRKLQKKTSSYISPTARRMSSPARIAGSILRLMRSTRTSKNRKEQCTMRE